MSTTTSPPAAPRLLFIDNLRWLMIVLVVTIHAAVTYSGVGSWYYKEPAPPGPVAFFAFVFYETHLQAFFMGLLFLVAGYFVPGSLDRKGARRFLADRVVRLGIPTALYAFVIQPAIVYYLLNLPGDAALPSPLVVYPRYLARLGFLSGTGPLWFALALLIFTGIYTAGRAAVRPRTRLQPEGRLPSHGKIISLIGVMALGSFLVRCAQPIGTDFYNMQLCFFPQYILLFGVGILAWRRNWLLRLPASFGSLWLKLALVAGPVLWAALMLGGGALKDGFARYVGGVHWQSAGYCLWESFFGVGVCLGLLVLFRERFNTQGRLARFLSANAFAVYVMHAPVLIALALALRGLAWPPPAKFLLLSAAGLGVSFLASHWVIRRIPGLGRVL